MEEMLKKMIEEKMVEGRTKTMACLEEARAFVEAYNEPQEPFEPGDLVVWKDGMNNRNFPAYGEPIMVLEVFSMTRRADDGGNYGCEPHDMRCITFKDDDGELMAYAYDSRRLRKA